MGVSQGGQNEPMRERVRLAPAWLVVLVFTLAALGIRLLSGPDASRFVAVGLLLVALAIVLIPRADGNGWGIYGVMVVSNLLMQATPWPLVVEAPLFLLFSMGAVWALYDRDRPSRAPVTASD
ncbi:MAG TPA: hypothetical protein VEX36_08615 [Thermoleophilaceae bacterium]|nr:hypothetical protein [Thermoleophilaceae bacterium]